MFQSSIKHNKLGKSNLKELTDKKKNEWSHKNMNREIKKTAETYSLKHSIL